MNGLTKLAAILAVALLAQAYGGTDQKPGVTYNADANGDGVIDITDPVMLLHWLFSDGPGPPEILAADNDNELAARIESLEGLLTASQTDLAAVDLDALGGVSGDDDGGVDHDYQLQILAGTVRVRTGIGPVGSVWTWTRWVGSTAGVVPITTTRFRFSRGPCDSDSQGPNPDGSRRPCSDAFHARIRRLTPQTTACVARLMRTLETRPD